MHDNSLQLCRHFVNGLIVHTTGPIRIGDVGSYDENGTYRELFQREGWEYLGFDIREGKNVDVVLPQCPEGWFCLMHNRSFDVQYRESFDVVISGQCMEHVAAPWKWIKDVSRLVKPGGIVWIVAPNTIGYHEFPIDCWRVWPAGMQAIFAEAELETLWCMAVGPDTVGVARKPK